MGRRPSRPSLSLEVPCRAEDSFKASDTTFTAGDLHIDRSGVYRDHSSEPEPSPKQCNGKLIQNIDDVQLFATLGRGSTSVVHSGVHRPTGLPLAVKEINVFEKDQRRSLLKELHTLYEADSPHLVNFYGAFYKEGSIYILLELMALGSLRDLLTAVTAQARTIPEFVIAVLANQVVLAFQYLHTHKRMVHRDIKPSNIVLSRDGSAKLTDFGVSTELGENAVATTFVGTCTYMSPERIMGMDYSYPSDIWSLGITMLECVLGRYPYPNSGVYIELMQSIVTGDVPVLSPADTTDDFRSFASLCLRKEPDARATASYLLTHPFITNNAGEDAFRRASDWIVATLKSSRATKTTAS